MLPVEEWRRAMIMYLIESHIAGIMLKVEVIIERFMRHVRYAT